MTNTPSIKPLYTKYARWGFKGAWKANQVRHVHENMEWMVKQPKTRGNVTITYNPQLFKADYPYITDNEDISAMRESLRATFARMLRETTEFDKWAAHPRLQHLKPIKNAFSKGKVLSPTDEQVDEATQTSLEDIFINTEYTHPQQVPFSNFSIKGKELKVVMEWDVQSVSISKLNEIEAAVKQLLA